MKEIIDHILIYHDVLSVLRTFDDGLVQSWENSSDYIKSIHSDFQEYREVELRLFVQSFLINTHLSKTYRSSSTDLKVLQ